MKLDVHLHLQPSGPLTGTPDHVHNREHRTSYIG
jgi:hypothetical protein